MAISTPRPPQQALSGGRYRSLEFGPFRPLVPFSEADRALFFGRERELADLSDILTRAGGAALLSGPAGSGKTSLVRAGLIPLLQSRGATCGLTEGLRLDSGQLPAATPEGALFIVDDLGAALDEGPRLQQLLALLQQAGQVAGLKLLFVVDDADLWRLESLERRLGHLGRGGARLRLGLLDEATTVEVIERTVLGGGAYFEAGLSQQMALDLCRHGPVSPAEVQLVAATAVCLRLTSARAWRRAGGAEALAWRFFEKCCQAAGGHLATRVLAELSALPERGAATLEQIAALTNQPPEKVGPAIEGLRATHLLRPVDEGWGLASEWLRPRARAFGGEAHAQAIRTRLLLRERVEAHGILSPRQLYRVRRFAPALAPEELQLVRRSRRVLGAAAGLLLVLLLAVPWTLYASYGRHCFFTAAAGPGSDVLVRLGRPSMKLTFLPHRPAFGAILADSGYARSALAGELPPGTPAKGAWLPALVEHLAPLPRALTRLVLEDEIDGLQAAYQEPSLRPAVIEALAAAGPKALPLLERALTDPAEALRRRALKVVVDRGPEGAPLLARALSDRSPAIRQQAFAAIAQLPEAQAVPLWSAALSGEVTLATPALARLAALAPRVATAAQALGRAFVRQGGTGEALATLSHLLEDPKSAEVAEAILVQVALDTAVPDEPRLAALRLLRGRPVTPAALLPIRGSAKVMAQAMPLLARLQPEGAQAQLTEALKGPPMMRAAAAATIGLLPRSAESAKQLKSLLGDRAGEVRVEAVRALPVLGREALPLLIKQTKGRGVELERAAVETLATARLGAAAAAQALRSVVKSASPTIRRAAIRALSQLAEAHPHAAGQLADLVRDPAAEVRLAAVEGLEAVLAAGGKEAVPALRVAVRAPDGATRMRAAQALGHATGPSAGAAARALGPFLNDAEPAVRAAAATSLGALGGSEAALAPLLTDGDAAVRTAARRALRGCGSAALDPFLVRAWGSARPEEKGELAAVAGAVGAVKTARAALAEPDPVVRRAALTRPERLGAAGRDLLTAALADPDAAVRLSAARGLVAAKEAEPLVALARRPELELRLTALAALGELGGARAQECLEGALDDGSERVRAAAAQALGHLGSSAASRLRRQLSDPARDVRQAVVAALGSVLSNSPTAELVAALGDESDGDLRYAAALALARQATTQPAARRALEETAANGTPAVRLSARLGRAFIGRPDAMVPFMRMLREGL